MLLEVTGVRLTGTLSYTWVEWFVPVMSVLSGAGGCLFSSPQQKLTKQPVFLSWWHCNLLKWILLFQMQQAHPYHYVFSNLTWGHSSSSIYSFCFWVNDRPHQQLKENFVELPLHAGPQFHLHISVYMSTHTHDCAHTQLYDSYPTQDHRAWPQIAQLCYISILLSCQFVSRRCHIPWCRNFGMW